MSFGPRRGPTSGNRRKERAVDLVISNPITPRDVPELCERVHLLVSPGRAIECDVAALVDPDIGTVDALARVLLTVKRLGGALTLRGTSARLEELLTLTGLEEVLLRLEAVGEPEQREEPLGVEEEADAGDLSAGDRQDL